jgi:putative oxidoreductase
VDATAWGLFIVRFGLGIIFLIHGAQQTFGLWGGAPLGESAAKMTHMGVPLFLAYISILTQLLGGGALVLGIFSRIAAIGLIIDMSVAIAMVHWKNGFFITSPTGPGFEFNLALIMMALAVLIAGPGAAGLADLEGKLFGRRA